MYKALGGIWISRLGMITFILVAIMVPVASLLPNTHAAVLPVLFFGMAINSVADLAAYSGSNVLVSPHLALQGLRSAFLDLPWAAYERKQCTSSACRSVGMVTPEGCKACSCLLKDLLL